MGYAGQALRNQPATRAKQGVNESACPELACGELVEPSKGE
jgi:hypothetical protein